MGLKKLLLYCPLRVKSRELQFDFAEKWPEAVGQSLHYALQTGKRAGIVLILENESDRKFWIRLNSSIEHFKLPIDTWSISESSYEIPGVGKNSGGER